MQSYKFYKAYAEISDEYEKGGRSLGLSITKLHQFFYEDVISPCRDKELMKYEHNDKYNAVKNKWDGVDIHGSEMKIAEKFNSSLVNLTYFGEKFKSGYTHEAPIVNTDKALAYLMALVQRKGATLETREVKDLKKNGQQFLTNYKADAIVNATGLGAKELVNDEDVYPVRGAIRRVENVRHSQFRHLNDAYLVPAQIGPDDLPSKTVFIVPWNDDILYVGFIIQPHNDTKNLTPESPEVQQMWDRAGDFMPSLRHAGFVNHFPFAQGLRPFTKKNVKVRADEDCGFPLIHNYGHGGSGWTLGVGTAQCAVHIVEKLISDKTDLMNAVEESELPDKDQITNGIKNGSLDGANKPRLKEVVQKSSLGKDHKERLLEVVRAWSPPAKLIDASAELINRAIYFKRDQDQ